MNLFFWRRRAKRHENRRFSVARDRRVVSKLERLGKERVRSLYCVGLQYLYHVQKRVPVFLFDYFGDLLLALDRYNFKLLSLIFFGFFGIYSYSNCFLISVQVA